MSNFYPDWQALEHFRFALIDASLRDTLPPGWDQTVIAPAFLGEDTQRCPTLIDLSALPDEERAQWCEGVHQQTLSRDETTLSLLLASPAPIQVVASHLARRMAIRIPGVDRPMQWRFFDPGTFLQLPRILGDAGMAWLLGDIDAVQVTWAGHWTHVICQKPAAYTRFVLSAAQVSALLRIGVVNRVASQGPPAEDAQAWIRQCQVIDGHVVRAQSVHGLERRDDLVAFAQDAWAHHPRIDEHPRMKDLLRQLHLAQPDDELDYRELRSQLQARDWAAMVADLQVHTQEDRTP